MGGQCFRCSNDFENFADFACFLRMLPLSRLLRLRNGTVMRLDWQRASVLSPFFVLPSFAWY